MVEDVGAVIDWTSHLLFLLLRPPPPHQTPKQTVNNGLLHSSTSIAFRMCLMLFIATDKIHCQLAATHELISVANQSTIRWFHLTAKFRMALPNWNSFVTQLWLGLNLRESKIRSMHLIGVINVRMIFMAFQYDWIYETSLKQIIDSIVNLLLELCWKPLQLHFCYFVCSISIHCRDNSHC